MSKPNGPSWLAAKKRGQFIIEGVANRVLCDLDSVEAREVFNAELCRLPGLVRAATFESATSGHYHGYVVVLAELPASKRVELAGVLGSDVEYVAHCQARVLAGDAAPIVLFETPEQFYEVHRWLAEGKDQL